MTAPIEPEESSLAVFGDGIGEGSTTDVDPVSNDSVGRSILRARSPASVTCWPADWPPSPPPDPRRG